MSGGIERMLEFDHPHRRCIKRGVGAVQLLLPLIQDFLGLEPFLHQSDGAVDFLLREQDLGFLLRHIGVCFVDRAVCLPDLGFRFLQRSGKVLRVHAGNNLAGFDQVTLVDEDFGDAGGVFGVDVNLVRFKPAVAENDTGRQRRVQPLPPVISAARAAAQNDECKHNPKPPPAAGRRFGRWNHGWQASAGLHWNQTKYARWRWRVGSDHFRPCRIVGSVILVHFAFHVCRTSPSARKAMLTHSSGLMITGNIIRRTAEAKIQGLALRDITGVAAHGGRAQSSVSR